MGAARETSPLFAFFFLTKAGIFFVRTDSFAAAAGDKIVLFLLMCHNIHKK